jgi:ABC-type uncharacterized transport system substrate-binding protein
MTEPSIVVATEVGVDAYAEALHGLERGLRTPPRVVDASNTGALRSALASSPPLIVALGSSALAALTETHTDVPILLAMVLDEAARGAKVRLAGSVRLDTTVSQVLDDIAAVFPGKTRLAIICNPAHTCLDAASVANARQKGFTVHPADCASAEDLLRTFLALRGKADFVVALPDSTLYNSATIKPLILASLENRLPLIGFSAAFVRSGAAMGIYPDFDDIGQQTAEAAHRILSSPAQAVHEGPRKHVIAINQRVLRLLGMDYSRVSNVVVFK